jgi:DNA-binding CsgD family transcriptional regulator
MMHQMRDASTLVGREPDLRLLDGMLATVAERGSSLLVVGDPGIGKSALLAQAAAAAERRGLLVLRAAGVESESRIPFAGLQQLLRHVGERAAELPPHQRDVLSGALGTAGTPEVNTFAVALAALSLLARVAADTPTLLLVEDLQWLDQATTEALAFVARRIDLDPIVLLASTRAPAEGPIADAGLGQLQLEGLGEADAAALLDAQPGALTPALRRRVLAEAAGNPLALVELPIAWRHLPEGSLLGEWVPLTARLEQAFAARFAGLSETARATLLVAALDDGNEIAEILAATSRLTGRDVTTRDLEEAAGLVEPVHASLRFRHPLVRSAIWQSVGLARRQAAHAALADVIDGEDDRRVWHRSAGALGKDELVAAELEAAAARAHRRGAPMIALTALERAASLSEAPAGRARRLLRAADIAFELGRPHLVARFLDDAERLPLSAADRAKASWQRELLSDARGFATVELEAIVELLEGEPALDALLTVVSRGWMLGLDAERRARVVATGERLAPAPDDARLMLLLALVDPVARGEVVRERLARLALGSVGDPEALRQLGIAASIVGAPERASAFLGGAIRGLRAQGRLGLLADALVAQAWIAWQLGAWRTAASLADEARRLAIETRRPGVIFGARLIEAVTAAGRGASAEAERLALEVERSLRSSPASALDTLVTYARGFVAAADGRPAEAFEHLRRTFTAGDGAHHPSFSQIGITEFVDAAVQSDHAGEAREVVRELETLLERTGSETLRAGLAYARPLLADDGHADAGFAAAYAEDLEPWPFIRARLDLAYGSWLRRRQRIRESRAPLRAARDALDAIGAVAWAERARQELRASGVSPGGHRPAGRDELTPQELQIAVLAADGLSNREIAEQLYLSPRTVASHLYRAYPKLGITSRGELSTALADR